MSEITDETWTRLTATIADVLGTDPATITPDMQAKDVKGWDSLAHLIIITQIEREFTVRLSADQLTSIRSIGDLHKAVAQSTI